MSQTTRQQFRAMLTPGAAVILPGVGAYADCAAGLRAVDGMWETVQEVAIARGRPFLGICVGMQLMADRGLEKTVTGGFGWIAGDVREIEPSRSGARRAKSVSMRCAG